MNSNINFETKYDLEENCHCVFLTERFMFKFSIFTNAHVLHKVKIGT